MCHNGGKALQHKHGESQEVQAGQGLWQAFVITGQPSEAGGPGEAPLNGLITNDKFCLSRTGRLTLTWSRRLPHLRDQPTGDTAYPSDGSSHRGGTYETPVEHSTRAETGSGRAAPVGPGLPAPSAMDAVERAGATSLLRSDAGGVP